MSTIGRSNAGRNSSHLLFSPRFRCTTGRWPLMACTVNHCSRFSQKAGRTLFLSSDIENQHQSIGCMVIDFASSPQSSFTLLTKAFMRLSVMSLSVGAGFLIGSEIQLRIRSVCKLPPRIARGSLMLRHMCKTARSVCQASSSNMEDIHRNYIRIKAIGKGLSHG